MRVTKKIKAEQLRRLSIAYAGEGTMLKYTSPFTLLVAVILSAQCTDKRVNIITDRIFPRLDTPEKMGALTQAELEREIHDCGLYKSKAKNLLGMCHMLSEEYDGKVPDDFNKLLKLPGVGRKSANLIMGDVFGKPAIVTDTHCIRLCNRIGLVDEIKEPKKVEMELWKIIPPEEGSDFCHRLVYHGRDVCTARTKPHCEKCCLADICGKHI